MPAPRPPGTNQEIPWMRPARIPGDPLSFLRTSWTEFPETARLFRTGLPAFFIHLSGTPFLIENEIGAM